ncbi:hypothetical protein QE152_g5708 [Popillia japonica]|uniref:Uncharacterized protein n=1 Tax=Popillia japonica TaxID=7064 RepID=A0AAW1MME4_POPJA
MEVTRGRKILELCQMQVQMEVTRGRKILELCQMQVENVTKEGTSVIVNNDTIDEQKSSPEDTQPVIDKTPVIENYTEIVEKRNIKNSGESENNENTPESNSNNKKIVNKELRMHGESYVGYRRHKNQKKTFQDIPRPARKLGSACNSNRYAKSTKMMCNQITEDIRMAIFTAFWQNMDWPQRKIYIGSLVTKKPTTRKSTEENSRRSTSLYYSLNVVYQFKKNQKPSSRNTFMKRVKEMQIAIFKPRKDMCDTCVEYNARNLSEEAWQSHRRDKQKAQDGKVRDKERAKLDPIVTQIRALKFANGALYYSLNFDNFLPHQLRPKHEPENLEEFP